MIYQTFMDHKLVVSDAKLKVHRRRIYFDRQTLDAGDGDVAEVIPIISGDVVLACYVNVISAAPENSTIDLGYGTIPNYWGNGLLIDSVGQAKAIIPATMTWNPCEVPDKSEMIEEVNVPGATWGDHVTVSPTVDIADMIVSGYVIHYDQVAVTFVNNTGGALDLPSQTINVILNKAPLASRPAIFSSSDTIDITATTDITDVDISSGVIDVYALILRP